MRHDKSFIAKLATWRELSPAQQSAIREHAAECPSCLEHLTHYEQQDRLLGGLPEMASRVTFADVLDRTEVHRRPFSAQRARAVALVLVLFLGVGAGAVSASGDAIPGDLLYPLKLSVETTRMWMAPHAARDELSARFAANRRIEVQALLSLNRSAELDIAGSVTDVRGSDWTVSGMTVTVPHEIWQGEPPALGQRIEMRVEVKAQEMRALQVRFAQHDGPAEGPDLPDPGPGTMPGDPDNSATKPDATPRGATAPDRPAATTEQTTRTAVPQPTATPVQAGTTIHAPGTPSGSAATPAAGGPATETAAGVSYPGSTASPEPGPAGPSRTPTGPQGGQPGGGGR